MKSKGNIIHKIAVSFLQFFFDLIGKTVVKKDYRIFIQKRDDLVSEDYIKIYNFLVFLVQKDEPVIEIYLNSEGGTANPDFFKLCDLVKKERRQRVIRTISSGGTSASAAAILFVMGSDHNRFLRKKTSKILLHGPQFYHFSIGYLYDSDREVLEFSQEEQALWVGQIKFYLSVLREYTQIPEDRCIASLKGEDLIFSGEYALKLKVADGYLS